MEDLLLLVGTIFDIMTDIFNLYTSTFILSGVLGLWLIRKVANVFRHL